MLIKVFSLSTLSFLPASYLFLHVTVTFSHSILPPPPRMSSSSNAHDHDELDEVDAFLQEIDQQANASHSTVPAAATVTHGGKANDHGNDHGKDEGNDGTGWNTDEVDLLLAERDAASPITTTTTDTTTPTANAPVSDTTKPLPSPPSPSDETAREETPVSAQLADDRLLAQLVSMGYGVDEAHAALLQSNNQLEAALTLLMDMDDAAAAAREDQELRQGTPTTRATVTVFSR